MTNNQNGVFEHASVEVIVTITETGPKGEQGIQGAQGIQGPKGDKGDTGPQGIQGEKGEQGIQGIQGEKGEKGDKGDKGDKGEKGDTGNGLEYTWNGTQLGVRLEGTTEYVYVDLKGEKGLTGSIDNLDITHIEDALGFIPKELILGEGPIENGWLFKPVTIADERNE